MGQTCPHVLIHVEGEEKTLTVSTEEGNDQSKSNDAEIEEVVSTEAIINNVRVRTSSCT